MNKIPAPSPPPAPVKCKKGCFFWIVVLLVISLVITFLTVAAVMIPIIVKHTKISFTTGDSEVVTPSIPQPAAPREAPPALKPDAALRLLYPDIPLQDGHVMRRISFPEGAEADSGSEENMADVWTGVDSIVPFVQGGKDKVFVVMSSVPPDMRIEGEPGAYPHATNAIFSLAVLTRDGASWAVETRGENLGGVGYGYGEMPKGHVLQYGRDAFAYMVDVGWQGQGYLTSSSVVAGPDGKGGLHVMAQIPMQQSNSGLGLEPEKTYEYDSEITVDMSDENAEFYPIRIKRKGTCQDKNDEILTVNHDVTYVFNAGGLVSETGDPAETECDRGL